MKQRIPGWADPKEEKALKEANEDFVKHLYNVFNDHLDVDHWTDADEDGMYAGVTITMNAILKNEAITIKDKHIEVLTLDQREGYIGECPLSEDQLKVVYFLLEEYKQEEMEAIADAKEHAKGPYHYNGVSIRDFL